MPAGFVLLSRPECGLCEEFVGEWQRLAARHPLPLLAVVDVDEYPDLARRHGFDIPVLMWDGVKVCQHRLDHEELLRLLRPR